MNTLRYLAACGLLGLVSACGGGGGQSGDSGPGLPGNGTTPPGGTSQLRLDSVRVTGYNPGAQPPARINPAMNSGQFDISWSVRAPDPMGSLFFTRLALSADPTWDPATDVEFATILCGTGPLLTCGLSNTMGCRFTSTVEFRCDTTLTTNAGARLDGLVTQLPMTAYVIVSVCDGLLSACEDRRAIEVVLE